MSVAPACSKGSKYSPGWFSEPLNIRCSNRCAKPLRPAGSFLLPTPYQMLTATVGALRSSCTITFSPLGRVNSWYGMLTTGAGLSSCAAGRKKAATSDVARASASAPVRGRRACLADGVVAKDVRDACARWSPPTTDGRHRAQPALAPLARRSPNVLHTRAMDGFRNCLVTGANRGLGLEFARQLLEGGAS